MAARSNVRGGPNRASGVGPREEPAEGHEADRDRDHRDDVVGVEEDAAELPAHRERGEIWVLPNCSNDVPVSFCIQPGRRSDMPMRSWAMPMVATVRIRRGAVANRRTIAACDDVRDEHRGREAGGGAEEVRPPGRGDEQHGEHRGDEAELGGGEVDHAVGPVDEGDPERDQRDAPTDECTVEHDTERRLVRVDLDGEDDDRDRKRTGEPAARRRRRDQAYRERVHRATPSSVRCVSPGTRLRPYAVRCRCGGRSEIAVFTSSRR